MKAKFLIFLICLFISTLIFSQKIEYRIVPFKQGGLWGYMNHKKEVIIEPKYEEAYPTYSFVGRIKYKGKYGYINNEGEIIIKARYDEASDFRHGISKVRKRKKTFYIRDNGKKNRESVTICGGEARYCFESFAYTEKKEVTNGGEKYILLPRGKNKFPIDTLDILFDSIFQFNKALFLQIDAKISAGYTK